MSPRATRPEDDRLDELRVQARYAHERHQLYRAKAQSARPTSPERLRELELADEQATGRLLFAESEERRSRASGD